MIDPSVESNLLPDAAQLVLVRRMELHGQLLHRSLEEEIAALVPVDKAWLSDQRSIFLGQQS